MFRLPKSVLAVGGAALATVLLLLAAPRTVHAVAAALVEVTNTSSNPVVTQTTGAQAANMVHLLCQFTMAGQSNACLQISSSAVLSALPYTVPSGNYLVITAADIAAQASGLAGCPGIYYARIGTVDGFLNLSTSDNGLTAHFAYPPPSGIVIAPDTPLSAFGFIRNPATGQIAGSCAGSVTENADIYGYLTTN
jgi:hypothetical protein